jgi:hypothetical protein
VYRLRQPNIIQDSEPIKNFIQSSIERVVASVVEEVIGEDEPLRKYTGADEPIFFGKNVIRNKLRRQQRKKLNTLLKK